MYNSQLDIFITVADCGSFNKAAEKLFISPTAVMKQINSLEKHIGVKLIERTAHGIRLTESGKQFYKDSKYIIKYSANAINRIRQIESSGRYVIRVGTSVLNPCKILMDLWGQVNDIYSNFKINVIPFEDDHNQIMTVIDNIGKKFDLIVGACDSPQWLSKCSFLKLGEYNECIAVPRSHRLAKKKLIQIEDLYGEKLFIVARGVSSALDRLHNELERKHQQIQLEETSYYDIDVFNRCEELGAVMLTLDAWSDVHPSLVTIPVDWDYKIPYGILYTLNPSENIVRFLDTIKKLI
jgi:DNA-binding transcriptional LysR family regulator